MKPILKLTIALWIFTYMHWLFIVVGIFLHLDPDALFLIGVMAVLLLVASIISTGHATGAID